MNCRVNVYWVRSGFLGTHSCYYTAKNHEEAIAEGLVWLRRASSVQEQIERGNQVAKVWVDGSLLIPIV